jgi:hypothetical protein
MDFKEYLAIKKIDAAAFEASDSERFNDWAALFEVLHPDSFTAQKKFYINRIRRKYLVGK